MFPHQYIVLVDGSKEVTMIGIHENEQLRALNNDYTLDTSDSDNGTSISTTRHDVTS